MNELLSITGLVAALLFFGFQIAAPMLMKRKIDKIATLRTEELRDIFNDPSHCIFFGAATQELEKRGESLIFTFPAFLDLALSRNMANVLSAPGPNSKYQQPGAAQASFLWGLWHGLILLVTFLVSLFNANVRIYEKNTIGRGYDFGFIIGASFSLGGSGSTTRHST